MLFAPPITLHEYEREVPRDRDFAVALAEGGESVPGGQGGRAEEAELPGTGTIQPGQEVLLMGAPAVGNLSLMYSVGRVLSDAEARRHDPQYDADKQFIVQASAAGRMSGGGVFARDGGVPWRHHDGIFRRPCQGAGQRFRGRRAGRRGSRSASWRISPTCPKRNGQALAELLR